MKDEAAPWDMRTAIFVAVPAANREAYHALAARMAPYFLDLGALRVVEAWGDDVPEGKITDFSRAVLAKPDEAVVFFLGRMAVSRGPHETAGSE